MSDTFLNVAPTYAGVLDPLFSSMNTAPIFVEDAAGAEELMVELAEEAVLRQESGKPFSEGLIDVMS